MGGKSVFAKTRYFIIDMDGTFYLSGSLISGSVDFIDKLLSTGRDYCFFTNNSSNNVAVCCDKLQKMGFPVGEDKIIISTFVAADYINSRYPGASVYLLGNERLRNDMIKAGVKLTEDEPDIVLLGFDTTITYEKIHKASRYIAGGCVYLATHPDVNCPTADGFMPDAGSFIELFYTSTGRRPVVLGKPETPTVDYITRHFACGRDEIAFVGDRLATDIAIGMNHSIPCALVYSGVTDEKEYMSSPIKADIAVKNLKELSFYI
ncbi:MAG: HAD-IIA family hydrolase [Clostridiales bacterium]|nr:HAD-IIA family hydrolase [Clostridiales bacterium]